MPREARYMRPKEVATLVRRRLKQVWPEVKFSVRTDTYAGGASIDARYTGGPGQHEVEKVMHEYQFARFDSMTDYGFSAYHWLNTATGRMRVARVEETASTRAEDNPCPGPGWELVSCGQLYTFAHRTALPTEPCAVCGKVPTPRYSRYAKGDVRGECEDRTCERTVTDLMGHPGEDYVVRRPYAEVARNRMELLRACQNNYQLALKEQLEDA